MAMQMLRLFKNGVAQIPYEIKSAIATNRLVVYGQRFHLDGFEGRGPGLDLFDEQMSVHIVAFGGVGDDYRGSVRLMQTTGPHLLRDAYPYLLDEGEPIESPRIWELSHLCTVTNDRLVCRELNTVDAIAGEMLAGVVEVSYLSGITHIIAVVDDVSLDILIRARCDPQLISRRKNIRGWHPHVAVVEVGELPLQRIKTAAGIKGAILSYDDMIIETADW